MVDAPDYDLIHPKNSKKNGKKRHKWPWFLTLFLLLVGAAGGYAYLYGVPESVKFWEATQVTEESPGINGTTTQEGTEEPAESETKTYKSQTYGFEFTYPAGWGEVNISTSPLTQAETGLYLSGTFTEKEGVIFGGPALGYQATARGGTYTDTTGFARELDSYHTLYALGELNTEPIRGALEGSFELVTGLNTVTLMYLFPESELLQPAAIGQINLHDQSFPGIAFVVPIGEDKEQATADLKSILESFKLLTEN
ncbi:MAG: hypothetical protein WDZ81_01050 [Candidatus Saccharimonadales bacterium]